MYIEGYLPNQEEIIKSTTEKVTLATQKADIVSFFKNGVSIDLIAKSMQMSVKEIQQILQEEQK